MARKYAGEAVDADQAQRVVVIRHHLGIAPLKLDLGLHCAAAMTPISR